MTINKSKTGPKYRRQKRAKGRDVAFVELNGQRVYLEPYGEPESLELYHRLLAEHSAGRSAFALSPSITVNEVLAAFWRFAEDYYADSRTELEKFRTVARIVAQLYGSSPASKFGPMALTTCRESVIDAGNCRRQVNQAYFPMDVGK